MKKILAVETSCDDTAVAVVRADGFVEHHLEVHQHTVHQSYGGIVPELASRNHVHHLLPLIKQVLEESHNSWEDISGLAVTNRPGLVGALMVGLVTIKTLSLVMKKPYVAVNHVEGHLLSPFLWDKECVKPSQLSFPFLALIVSGAHTHLFVVEEASRYRLIGHTVDDAAGEALDKFARQLGLGYPGGAKIDKLSQGAELGQYHFPLVQLKKSELNFSFSGLKTAAGRKLQKLGDRKDKKWISNLCADYQEAIVDHTISRLEKAIQKFSLRNVMIAGGVSANSRLRVKSHTWANKNGVSLVLPQSRYCTDNAAMIGYAAFAPFLKGQYSHQDTNCYPYTLPSDFL